MNILFLEKSLKSEPNPTILGLPDSDKSKDANMDKNLEIAFNKEESLKHLSKDVFIVKYKERSTGKTFEINPNIDNPFYDALYRNLFRSGEYILISGELPDKWK